MDQDNRESQSTREKRRQDAADTLQGWPGYRTRDHRSGLDPLDTRAEAGHMTGLFLRRLLTGTLLTRNPFYLFLLGIFGLLFLVPLIAAIAGVFQGYSLPIAGWTLMALLALAGLLVLLSLVRSLLHFLSR